MTTEIDILVPVLGRPQNAARLVQSIKDATTVAHEIVFLCSLGDTKQIEACKNTDARVEVVPWKAGASDYPKKMNYGYSITESTWMLLAADDLKFERGWDEEALKRAGEFGVIGTNDCTNRHFSDGKNSTHPLVRRSYVDILGGSADGPGVLIHEGYDHNFSERELNGLAQHRRLYIYVAASKLHHLHPLWKRAPMDKTYMKGSRKFRMDKQTFFKRAKYWHYKGLGMQERRVAMRMR